MMKSIARAAATPEALPVSGVVNPIHRPRKSVRPAKAASAIPVLRPRLPTVDRLLPYLTGIDERRIYGNFGPLAIELENRLIARYALGSGTIVSIGNATIGLSAALLAQDVVPGSLCVMPAWTFIASAHAATAAGLVPYFIDVDPTTWALDPAAVLAAIGDAPGTVGAVMPVMPFGQPIDGAAWDRFFDETGIPVVIDAAAGFDALRPSRVPSVVSLHATKILGVGEGGFIASTDPDLVQAIRLRINFGFSGNRLAQVASYNGKLSEYHAAVGLAAMDEWSAARAEWQGVARGYRARFAGSNSVRLQPGFGDGWIAATCTVTLPGPDADRLAARLREAGIETRHWWGAGAHLHPATEGFPRGPLPVTERLGKGSIGLPFYRDLMPGEMDRVASAVLSAIE